jgi:hypothetical protein
VNRMPLPGLRSVSQQFDDAIVVACGLADKQTSERTQRLWARRP